MFFVENKEMQRSFMINSHFRPRNIVDSLYKICVKFDQSKKQISG